MIRDFAEADWSAVAAIIDEVLVAGETYATAPLDDAAARAFWLTGEHVVVAQKFSQKYGQKDGLVLGTARMGPNRPAQGSHVGTASFMVSAAARGQGVGRELAEYVVAWHRDHGYRGIQFNAVVETNTAAVRLWHELGFETIGTVPGAFRRPDGSFVGLHVMYLAL